MVLRITFRGLDDVQNKLIGMEVKAPETRDDISRKLAQDVQRGARARLTARINEPAASTGRLWSNILAMQQGQGIWRVGGIEEMIYGPAQERGQVIPGYKFLRKPGYGRRGEGFMIRAPGYEHRIIGKRFFADAVASTLTRASSIANERIKLLVERGI